VPVIWLARFFATHYFEITQLADDIGNIDNIHLSATEHQNDIIFLYAIQSGAANQSYGIQVAKLAGLPEQVLDLARQKLQFLESQNLQNASQPLCDTQSAETVDMFSSQQLSKDVQELADEIADIDADALTPRAALDKIYLLKEKLKNR